MNSAEAPSMHREEVHPNQEIDNVPLHQEQGRFEGFNDSQGMLGLLSGTFTATQDEKTQIEEKNPNPTQVEEKSFGASQGDGLLGLLSGQFDTQASLDMIAETHKAKMDSQVIPMIDLVEEETEEAPVEVEEVEDSDDSEISETPAPLFRQLTKSINDLISESEESSSDDEEEEEDDSEEEEEGVPLSSNLPIANPLRAIISWNTNPEGVAPGAPPRPTGSKFIETEAEVEEDEFMNYGGIDGEELLNGKDEYDKAMLADSDEEPADLAEVLDFYQ